MSSRSLLSGYRLKRGPALAVLLVVGLVGALLIGRSSTRPGLVVLTPVTVPAAYAGTTYAFDGLVCVQAGSIGARVSSVEGSTAAGVRTEIALRPPGAPPAVAFPVPADASLPLQDLELPGGGEQCARVLVTADGQGERAAGPVEVRFRYGPFGLFRSGSTVTPPVVLQVTGTGTDPRATS